MKAAKVIILADLLLKVLFWPVLMVNALLLFALITQGWAFSLATALSFVSLIMAFIGRVLLSKGREALGSVSLAIAGAFLLWAYIEAFQYRKIDIIEVRPSGVNSRLGQVNATPFRIGQTVYVSARLAEELIQSAEYTGNPIKQVGEPAEVIEIQGELVSVRFQDGSELRDFYWRWFSSTPEGIPLSCEENNTPFWLGQPIYVTPALSRHLDSTNQTPRRIGEEGEVVAICGNLISVRFTDGEVLDDLYWAWFSAEQYKWEEFRFPTPPPPPIPQEHA